MEGNQSSILQPNSSSNTSHNGSTIDPDWPFIPIQPKQGLVLFIITLIGVSANFFAFLATLKLTRKQKNAINYLIIALSITDTYGIVFCTLPTLLCYARRQWVGGLAMCNFQGVSTMFASLASASLATAMAMERLFAIWKPFLYRKTATKKKSLMTIGAIWSVTMVIALFPLSNEGNFVRNLTGTYCTINWFARNTANIAYAIFYVIMGAILLGIVLFCNINIAYRLILRGKIRKGLTRDSIKRSLMRKKSDGEEQENTKSKLDREPSASTEMIDNDVINRTSSAVEKQLAKTVAVISFLFAVCWAPFIVRIVCNLTGIWVNAWVDVQVSRLLLINFVLDPFLYTLSRKQCRDIVKGWLCCCCVRRKGGRHSASSSWFNGIRKKHRSSLSSSQTGSGHINTIATTTSNIQLLQVKSSSVNTTPDHSITDAIVHSSDAHDSESPSKAEVKDQKHKGDEIEQSIFNSKESNGDTKCTDETGNHSRRLHSEVHHPTEVVASLEKTKSLPNIEGKQKGKDDKDMKVNVGYMYDLAFQRQASNE